jgi:hypothetical protein
LTREAARNDINNASPWRPVKGANVIPDGERLKNSVVLSLAQKPNSEWLPFDGADGSPSKQLAAENSSTSAREKCQLIHSPSLTMHATRV